MTPETLLVANHDAIDRAIRCVAWRGGLSPEDVDDLAATVKLALIDDDYAVLRAFQGRCSLATYVASIAHRLLADDWMRVSGRWRPSAQSKRAGEGAVLLEMLVVRDRKTLDEALPLVQKLEPSMTRQSATALLDANGMRVQAIARAWRCDPQILYRRIETLVRRLRRKLVGAGIDAVTAAQLIGTPDGNLEFGWTESEKTAAVQTIPLQKGGAGEPMS